MTADQLFKNKCIFGMVHCLPLPGTKDFTNMQDVKAQALADADVLQKGRVDAIIVENMNDVPAGIKMDTEQITALAAMAALVKERVSVPVGIDAAFNDYEAGISTALAIGADFVRVPVFVDTVVTASGTIHPCAREAVRYRRAIGAEHILLICDIQPKHTYMLVDRISLRDSAVMAEQNGADAIIVTGTTTGAAASMDDIRSVKESVGIPVVVGSGFNANNAAEQLKIADGAIVGSAFKEGGVIMSPVKLELVQKLMTAVRG